jgi:CHAT domain-containing protein
MPSWRSVWACPQIPSASLAIGAWTAWARPSRSWAIDTEVKDAVEEFLVAERSATIPEWEARHELNEAVFARLVRRLNFLIRDDRDVAVRTIEYLFGRAEEQNNKEWQARLILARSNVHLFNGDYRATLELADAAIAILQSLGNEPRMVRAWCTKLQTYVRCGMLKEGLKEAEELMPLVEKLEDPLTSAMFMMAVGLVYEHLGRFEESVHWNKKGIELALQQNELDRVFITYVNMARSLMYLHRFDEALDCCEKAIADTDRIGSITHKAMCFYMRAYLFFMQGRYREALDGMKTARVSLKQCNVSFEVACVDVQESELHLECNLFEKAIARAQSAYREFRKLGAKRDCARALGVAGLSAGRLGNYETADALLSEARATFYDMADYPSAALTDLHRAQLLFERDSVSVARELAEQAYVVFDNEKLVSRAAYAQALRARCLLRENDRAGARAATDAALHLSEQIQMPALSYHVHQLEGDFHYREGNWVQAHRAYLQALHESEQLRSNLAQDENRLSFAYDKEKLFESLMKTCFDLNRPELSSEAFDVLEKAKSRTLADLITRSVGVMVSSESGENADTDCDGNSLLQLHEDHSAAPQPISLKAIQNALDPNTALIEYFFINERIGAFVVTRNRVEVLQELAEHSEVRKHTRLLDFQLSRFRLGGTYTRSNEQNLNEIVSKQLRLLHTKLFQPLEKWLDGCLTCLIVPHGILHRVPFHLLLGENGYVIDKYAISYAPSATVYSLCSSRPNSSSQRPLIVSVEDSQIPAVAEEVASLRELWPEAHVLQNEAATYSGFRSQCETANIVHIATHADFREDNAMFSSVRLVDRWVNVADIYGLNMTADLVTLSGCGTGRGALRSGDEIIGLVRGFLYAGARCLLVSLWDVHDGSASEMMRHFYQQVANGKGFAEALQAAMQATREKRPHPYYWGSFRLVGYGH